MMHSPKYSGTILIYTMILVILWVLMATVILNVASELSNQFEVRNIETGLINMIQTKSDLTMKYARNLNENGNGFTDTISCPLSVTMSGATQVTNNFTTTLKNELWLGFCEGIHNSEPIRLYFNTGATDLEYAQFRDKEVVLSSVNPNNTFNDIDTTFIDISSSLPLTPDLIDDNFDSDNYQVYSTWTVLYPDIFVDDDVHARLRIYWYVIENSGPYNVFWSYDAMGQYIDENTYNQDNYNTTLSQTWSGYLYLDINNSHQITLFEIDKEIYNTSKELVVLSQFQSEEQTANLWYLQDNMTLASWTGNAFVFDFQERDYALFIENTSSGALLYQITWEEAGTGSGIYMNPLKDDDLSLFSYLWSHMFIGEWWSLIGADLELFGLK